MQQPLLVGTCALLCLVTVLGIENVDPVGEPLFLTPYIEQGQISHARKLARNLPLQGHVESYSGFLTVNASTDTNTFFWYFSAEKNRKNAPVLVWLQGGPGASSMFGALFELGPYELQRDISVKRRKHSWSKDFHLLFIDNPAATGFSFSSSGDYAKNQEHVGSYLLVALKQFFVVFHELAHLPLYITGESYGGKYVPALAHTIHVNNQRDQSGKINLQGIAIGNGVIDPVNMIMAHGPHLYQLGMLDDHQLTQFNKKAKAIVNHIHEGKWHQASLGFADFFLNSTNDLLFNVTGFSFHYNILESKDDGTTELLNKFMNLSHIRKTLHVGKLPFNDGSIAMKHLFDDQMKSILPWFVDVVENYNVLLYSGQLDIIIPYPMTVSFLKKMNWSGQNEYRKASRKIWRSGNDIAGYTKTVYHNNNEKNQHFTEILVRNAGHMVPMDQPEWGFEMIKKFVTEKEPF